MSKDFRILVWSTIIFLLVGSVSYFLAFGMLWGRGFGHATYNIFWDRLIPLLFIVAPFLSSMIFVLKKTSLKMVAVIFIIQLALGAILVSAFWGLQWLLVIPVLFMPRV